jgi:hypothetical protein
MAPFDRRGKGVQLHRLIAGRADLDLQSLGVEWLIRDLFDRGADVWAPEMTRPVTPKGKVEPGKRIDDIDVGRFRIGLPVRASLTRPK